MTILLPLCGKAVDLRYLYDLGHTVIGIEAIEQGAREFFEENEMTANKRDIADGVSVFEASWLYVIDLFKHQIQ